MIKLGRMVALGTLMLAAGCVPRAEAPAPVPAPEPPPPPTPPPPPSPAPAQNWSDLALTAGSWSYREDGTGSQAMFGSAATASFTFRCDRGQRRIILSRQGAAAGDRIAIRTSFGTRTVPVAVENSASAHSDAAFAASDPFLDSLVFSRGRFTVEASGLPMLVIPTWPEPARVIEDCRG